MKGFFNRDAQNGSPPPLRCAPVSPDSGGPNAEASSSSGDEEAPSPGPDTTPAPETPEPTPYLETPETPAPETPDSPAPAMQEAPPPETPETVCLFAVKHLGVRLSPSRILRMLKQKQTRPEEIPVWGETRCSPAQYAAIECRKKCVNLGERDGQNWSMVCVFPDRSYHGQKI